MSHQPTVFAPVFSSSKDDFPPKKRLYHKGQQQIHKPCCVPVWSPDCWGVLGVYQAGGRNVTGDVRRWLWLRFLNKSSGWRCFLLVLVTQINIFLHWLVFIVQNQLKQMIYSQNIMKSNKSLDSDLKSLPKVCANQPESWMNGWQVIEHPTNGWLLWENPRTQSVDVLSVFSCVFSGGVR